MRRPQVSLRLPAVFHHKPDQADGILFEFRFNGKLGDAVLGVKQKILYKGIPFEFFRRAFGDDQFDRAFALVDDFEKASRFPIR